MQALATLSTADLVDMIAAAVVRKMAKPADETPAAGFWTVADVAAFFKISAATVWRKVDAGEIPPPDMGRGRGKKALWRADKIQEVKSCI